MNTKVGSDIPRRQGRWKTILMVILLIMMVPMIATQVSDHFAWDLVDFVVFGVLLLGCGFTYELVTRREAAGRYRFAVGIAIVTSLLMIIMSLGVGIIGADGDPMNLVYFGVILVGLLGAIIVRLKSEGMARVMIAMVVAQALVVLVAFTSGMHLDPWSSTTEILGINAFFALLFLVSGWLFHSSALPPQTE